ncbi:MAG: class I SAM-dependent methyltransferase [Phycisphaerales bacterium]|jgi:hypothetical protein|nr:class I SAM-dependent methyltransferase [Phycisphaerales bacterium]
MRVLMGERQRERILSMLPEGGRMLEWGSGGSTLWFGERLPRGAKMVSVEHHAQWADEVRDWVAHLENVELRFRPSNGPERANATIEEEDARGLEEYVRATRGEDEKFDVILVDGVARCVCMERARELLAPGGTIFLHDAQRDWYDEGKAKWTEHGHIGSCADYPGPHLWWGGREEIGRGGSGGGGSGELPLIVSFYTTGTRYEDEARRLIASCQELGLEHDVRGIKPRGTWEANCAMKASFVRSIWREAGRPVLWLDADAVVRASPELLRGAACDLAVRKVEGWSFASGTVYFGRGAGELLEEWVARCEREPRVWDQVHLDHAWEAVCSRSGLETWWLPRGYTHIFDEGACSGVVVEHMQASRRLKAEVSSGVEGPEPARDEEIVRSRAASRPRARVLDGCEAHGDVPVHAPLTHLPWRVKRAMVDRLALECAARGVRRIALYGAGEHTERLGPATWARRGVEVVAVLDDQPRAASMMGVPIVRPVDLRESIDAVVVSSDAHEDAIARRAEELFTPKGVEVLRIYEWKPLGERSRAARLAG